MTNVEESKSKENILVINIDPATCKEGEHLSPGKTASSAASSTSSTSSMTANPTSEEAPAPAGAAAGAAAGVEYVESDDHLPRVQEELDTLNYANEAINNLELELDECKREHASLVEESEEQLKALEKKLGSCVSKCRPYYELRPEVDDLKAKYLKAKHRFETAQELYVAAKNMQMYAEENLENFEIKLGEAAAPTDDESNISQVNTASNDVSSISYASSSLGGGGGGKRRTQHLNDGDGKEMLTRILEDAKKKVIETESAKHINDQLQIDAFMVYGQKLKIYEQMEKDLRRSIDKSREYYDLKAELDKEINFSGAKVEGLKSCLKEAKLTYHQALKNLERISTEIHTQRQTSNLSNALPPSSAAPTATNESAESAAAYDTSNSSSSLVYQNGADSSLNNRLFSANDSFSEFAEDLDAKSAKATSFENSKLALSENNNSNNNNKSSNSDLDLTTDEHDDYDQYFKNSSSTVKSPSNSLFTNLDSKSPLESSPTSQEPSSPPVTSTKEQPVQSRPQFRLPALLRSQPK